MFVLTGYEHHCFPSSFCSTTYIVLSRTLNLAGSCTGRTKPSTSSLVCWYPPLQVVWPLPVEILIYGLILFTLFHQSVVVALHYDSIMS
jgi:hypothetical protein